MMNVLTKYWNCLRNDQRWIFSLVLCLSLVVSCAGQLEPYKVDSTDVFLEKMNKKVVNHLLGFESPKPKRAVFLSMIVPGAGQVYNRQAWKLPAIYGGYGALLYMLSTNQDLYQRFDAAYRASIAGETHEFPRLNTNTIKSYRDQTRKNVELTYIGMGAVYVITLLDAFVSAHLSTFDVSEDLSLYIPNGNLAAPVNIGIAYRF